MQFKLKKFKKAVNVSKIANIHYFEFTGKYETFKDKHEFRELVYVDSGKIRVESENFSGVLGAGRFVIHKEGEVHSLICFKDAAPSVIIIGFECFSPELDGFAYRDTPLSETNQRLLADIIKEGRTVFMPPYDQPNVKDMKKRKNYPFGADQMIKLKLETLLIELVRSAETVSFDTDKSAVNPKLEEIYNYINENFRLSITLDELCFLCGTNKTTLCSTFKNAYGDTIVNYINKLRIKEAKKLLREGNLNLTQIAERTGFSSVHYFSRLFKQRENMSPTEYIKTVKSKLEIS
ncbi:MAG: helix-turn-helix transcriptional regulator [Clostridia bacterium]|nr:helix-turn-helix transcriptional regulator [Clostridia bacterium]